MADKKALYKQGFDAFSSGDYDTAIEKYGEVIALDPDFSLVYQALAEVYARREELDRAIESIDRAIEIEPDESLFHTSKSRFLQRQGKVPEAESEAAIAQQLQSRGGV